MRYTRAYAETYDALYLHGWERKHATNIAVLESLRGLHAEPGSCWIDLACGQAWHFAQLPSDGIQVGVDISEAQLAKAVQRAPKARFVLADLGSVPLAAGCATFVTGFWAGYCYLGTVARVLDLFRRATEWIAPGGALYVEVLPPEHLASFNTSRFAARTGFRVEPVSPDYVNWVYRDLGGVHRMCSPPLPAILAVLAPHFQAVRVVATDGFMCHVVAQGRR